MHISLTHLLEQASITLSSSPLQRTSYHHHRLLLASFAFSPQNRCRCCSYYTAFTNATTWRKTMTMTSHLSLFSVPNRHFHLFNSSEIRVHINPFRTPLRSQRGSQPFFSFLASCLRNVWFVSWLWKL